MELGELTIAKAREHLDGGDISAAALAQQYLEVIEKKDKNINAFLEVFDDVAIQAERADKMIEKKEITPLTGIPIAVKDNILIQGKTASAASKILETYTATYDATVIKKLKAAGALFLGRANMDEFAMGSSTENSAFQTTKNPHDTTRVPGGTSGGSAAAVAAGMALGALGSDTAGSIRFPGGLCGVVGFKPTYGTVSRYGLIALGSSLDVIGPLARTVDDAKLLFEAIAGKDKMDSTTVDANDYPAAKKKVQVVGVPRVLLDELSYLDERVRTNFETSLEALKDAGYKLVDITLPHFMYGLPSYYIILPAEASANLARFDGVKYGHHADGKDLLGDYIASRGEGFGSESRRRIVLGTYVLSAGYHDAYYNRATAVRGLIRSDYTSAFADVDVIVTPTQVDPAFKLGEKVDDPVQMYLQDVFTVNANLTGMPALSVPSGTVEEDGVQLPVGLHFVAPHVHEHLLFEIGKAFESQH